MIRFWPFQNKRRQLLPVHRSQTPGRRSLWLSSCRSHSRRSRSDTRSRLCWQKAWGPSEEEADNTQDLYSLFTSLWGLIQQTLTYPFGMSESSLFPGSFSVCCLILSSRPEASAPWYWSTRTRFRKNKNVGVAEMLLAAAVAWEKHKRFWEVRTTSRCL